MLAQKKQTPISKRDGIRSSNIHLTALSFWREDQVLTFFRDIQHEYVELLSSEKLH